jgi:hypothetical protein
MWLKNGLKNIYKMELFTHNRVIFSTYKNYASHLYMLLRNIFKGEEYYYCQNFIIVIIIVKYIVIMFIMFLYEDIEWNERKRIEVLSFLT